MGVVPDALKQYGVVSILSDMSWEPRGAAEILRRMAKNEGDYSGMRFMELPLDGVVFIYCLALGGRSSDEPRDVTDDARRPSEIAPLAPGAEYFYVLSTHADLRIASLRAIREAS